MNQTLSRWYVDFGKNIAGLGALFLSCDNLTHDIAQRFAGGDGGFTFLGIRLSQSSAAIGTALLIAVVYYAITGTLRLSYRRSLRQFFGVDKTLIITMTIPSYRCVGNEHGTYGSFGHDAFHSSGSDMFYKVRPDRRPLYKKAFQSPICASTDVSTYFFAVSTLGPDGVQFKFEIDEEFINPERLLPRPDKIDKCKSVICFGSASSNYVAAYLNGSPFFSKNVNTYSFVSTDQLTRNGHGGAEAGVKSHLRSSKDTDYAVIAKHQLDGVTYFLCAGIDQAGSIVALQILLHKWKELNKQTGGRDFFWIYKVNRKALRPEELYSERKAAESYYTYTVPREGPEALTRSFMNEPSATSVAEAE